MITVNTILKTFPVNYTIGDLFKYKIKDMPIVTMNKKGVVCFKTFTHIKKYHANALVTQINFEDGSYIVCSHNSSLFLLTGGKVKIQTLRPDMKILKIIEFNDYYKKIPLKVSSVDKLNTRMDLYSGIVQDNLDRYCLYNGVLITSR